MQNTILVFTILICFIKFELRSRVFFLIKLLTNLHLIQLKSESALQFTNLQRKRKSDSFHLSNHGLQQSAKRHKVSQCGRRLDICPQYYPLGSGIIFLCTKCNSISPAEKKGGGKRKMEIVSLHICSSKVENEERREGFGLGVSLKTWRVGYSIFWHGFTVS